MPRRPRSKSETLPSTAKSSKPKQSVKTTTQTTEKAQKPKQVQKPVEKSEVEQLGLPPHAHVKWEQVWKAASELKKYAEKPQSKEKKNLLSDDNEGQKFFLQLTMNKCPYKYKARPHLFNVPFPFTDPEVEICLFLKDENVSEYKQFLREKQVTNVVKVMGLTKLRDNWGRFEAKRKLCQSYDMFLCDENISLVLNGLLGKPFVRANKMPLQIRVSNKDNIKARIDKVRDATFFRLGAGTLITLAIGTTKQSPSEVTKNIASILDKVISNVPDNWAGLESIGLRTEKSVTLPFYVSLSPVLLKNLKAAEEGEKVEEEEEEKEKEEKEEEEKKEVKKAKGKKGKQEAPKPKEVAQKPVQTPKQTPKQTPEQPTKQTPNQSPKQTPKQEQATKQTPKQAAKQTPKQSPKQTPKQEQATKQTPKQAEQAAKQTPKQTPKQNPQKEQTKPAEEQKGKKIPTQSPKQPAQQKKTPAQSPKQTPNSSGAPAAQQKTQTPQNKRKRTEEVAPTSKKQKTTEPDTKGRKKSSRKSF